LTLSADWVILSACNTAAGNGDGAEGLSGLARAFFAAGAQTLLVSHWPVRDDAAARLTAHAFAEIKADPTLGKAEAMRRSMIALAQDGTDPTLAHPTAWAPFFVVGG
ncbi:MAG: CHAT domain-containing protein, partial [Pseudomonadota bacterium]